MGWFERAFSRGERGTGGKGTAGGGLGAPVGLVGGRVRVRGVPYNLPRDLEEMNRLDFQHYLFRAALRGNYVVPLVAPRCILDVGTGTGRWAREMALLFPQARVIGLDISPPPADSRPHALAEFLPPNYTFEPGNVLEGLSFPDGSFDLTHMRLLVSAIPHDRWQLVVSELVRVTSSGGWVESVEPTLPTDGGPVAEQLMDWIRAISVQRGVDITDATRVGERMRAAGLMRVITRTIHLPCGAWGGRVGNMMVTDYFAGVRAVGGVIVARGLASQEQFDQTLAQALKDINSSRYQCYMPIHIAMGQRA